MYRTEENLPLYRWEIFDRFRDRVDTGITTRNGGFSHAPYNTFNLALHCGDDREAVVKNRKLLCSSLGLPFESYTCAEQTHGTSLEKAASLNCGAGRDDYANALCATDALYVEEPGILINIHLADCTPVALYDPVNNRGALVHAGWKGTAGLIVYKTVNKLAELAGGETGRIIAGIGPSIGPCCYEIGGDTAVKLTESFSYNPGVVRYDGNSIHTDLREANRQQLLAVGLHPENIEVSEICTSCSPGEFFSHRGGKGKTGRFSAYLFLK